MNVQRTLACSLVAITLFAGQLIASEDVYNTTLKSSAFILAGDVTGSGALVDADQQLVFTNYHVVGEKKEVRVVFPTYKDGELVTERANVIRNRSSIGVRGRVVDVDPRRDLALIEIDSVPSGVEPIKLADRSASPGQTVHSIGNPGASAAMWLYTSGTVRQVYRRKINLDGTQSVHARVVETQAPINKGDSGGPVVNDNGELVAVVSAFHKEGNLVSYAIDVRELRELLAGENSTTDRRITQLADQEGWEYTTEANGIVMMKVPTKNGTSLVQVPSKTSTYLDATFRSVSSLGKSLTQPLDGKTAQQLMKDSFENKFGGWMVLQHEPNDLLVYRIDVAADASPEVLKATIMFVANVTANFRGKGNTPAPFQATVPQTTPTVSASQLTGTWVANVVQSGKQMKFQVAFGNDGTISWDATAGSKRVLDMSGTFEVNGNELSYNCNGTQYTGTIDLQSNGRMTFDDGSLKLNLNRVSATPRRVVVSRPVSKPTLIGRWSSTKNDTAGRQVTNTMTFSGDKFTWKAKSGSIETLNLSGTFTFDGETLKLKAAAGLTYKATVKLVNGGRMTFKDATNDLEFTRQ